MSEHIIMKEELSIVQPNPGWGMLCEKCSNRHLNLVIINSDFPCKKAIFYGATPHPVYGRALLPNLVRRIDELETCSDYEKSNK